MTEQVTLKDGTELRCRPVPPHAALAIHAEYDLPQPPTTPMKQVESKAGHSEPLPIGPGDDGWDEFTAARDEWHTEYARIKDEIAKREGDFVLDYAVVEWKRPDGEWLSEPPASWEFPRVLLRHGIKAGENERLDYIKYELLQSHDDILAVQNVALSSARPLSREEVDAGRGKFRAEDEGGRPGTEGAETEGGRDAHLQHDVLPRDAGGEGMGSVARRLVRRIQRK